MREDFVERLHRRRAELDAELQAELARVLPDFVRVQTIKKKKLRLRDRAERFDRLKQDRAA